MKHLSAFFLSAAIALPGWAGGDSSDGHTHGAAESIPAAIPTTDAAPRASAVSEEFELVAVLEGRQLRVYLDRFASNEPVTNAKVDVEGGGLKGLARESAPGTYVIDLAAALPSAKHALTIGVEAGDSADLLAATLDTTRPVTGDAHIHGWGERSVWIVAALLLLAAGALLIVRRRRTRRIQP